MKRCLIVTADDFGFSKERNQGIIEAFQNLAVKSASLLLNCTGSVEAAQFFRTQKLFAGLHLNLTEGCSLSCKKHSTLTDPTGTFWGKFELRNRLADGKINSHEIQEEIQSQIDHFKELVGQNPLYVDGHQHIHVHPAVAKIFASTLKENGIFITRFPIELRLASKDWVKPQAMEFYTEVMNNTEECRPIFDSCGIRYTDTFVGLSTMGSNMTISRLQSSILEAFKHAEACRKSSTSSFVSCELMTHPGYPTGQNAGGFDGLSDEFGCSMDRQHEVVTLSCEEMMAFYREHDIILESHEILVQD